MATAAKLAVKVSADMATRRFHDWMSAATAAANGNEKSQRLPTTERRALSQPRGKRNRRVGTRQARGTAVRMALVAWHWRRVGGIWELGRELGVGAAAY